MLYVYRLILSFLSLMQLATDTGNVLGEAGFHVKSVVYAPRVDQNRKIIFLFFKFCMIHYSEKLMK